MFNQCMGDGMNGNQYYWGQPGYGHYGQWSYDGYNNATPWYNQCPYNNWNWYTGYNNYEQSRAPCPHYYAENPNMPLLNDPNNEYKMYQRRVTGHYLKPEASSMTDPPLWKSVKIDCFSAKMNMHKTQSELLKKSSRFLINKASRRKNRKRRFSGAARSTTTMKNSFNKLGKKVYLNGGGLAYILFKPKECECDEQNRGDGPDVPFTYYPSKKRHDMEKEFYENMDRQLNESEQEESQTAKSKEYINNLNKLYADINGGLDCKSKSGTSHCTPEELAEIRHEFEVFFNKTTRTSKQTQTKLKMKTLKSGKTKGRMKWNLGAEPSRKLFNANKQTAETTKHTLRKDIGLKSKKTRLPTTFKEPLTKRSVKETLPSKSKRAHGSNKQHNKDQNNDNENDGVSTHFVWRPTKTPSTTQKASNVKHLGGRSGRSVSYHPGRTVDDAPKPAMRSTFAKFGYSTAWRRK
uniref:Digestive organ expansion factor homolog n=1 Tax=Zeugodacus cucurbitae TaxID=28588 RepID=A0A0A1XJU3_ZEUCU